jgi:hypothetical protein
MTKAVATFLLETALETALAIALMAMAIALVALVALVEQENRNLVATALL